MNSLCKIVTYAEILDKVMSASAVKFIFGTIIILATIITFIQQNPRKDDHYKDTDDVEIASANYIRYSITLCFLLIGITIASSALNIANHGITIDCRAISTFENNNRYYVSTELSACYDSRTEKTFKITDKNKSSVVLFEISENQFTQLKPGMTWSDQFNINLKHIFTGVPEDIAPLTEPPA